MKKKNEPEKPDNRFKSWRAKWDYSFPDNLVETKVFIKNPTAEPENRLTPVPVRTVTDIHQHCPWGSRVRLIVAMSKVWAAKQKRDVKKDKFRDYGITLKIIQMEVTPRESQNIRQLFSHYAFLDGSEETTTTTTKTIEDKKEENEENSDENNSEDDNEENSEDENNASSSESEEEPQVQQPPKKAPPKRVARK